MRVVVGLVDVILAVTRQLSKIHSLSIPSRVNGGEILEAVLTDAFDVFRFRSMPSQKGDIRAFEVVGIEGTALGDSGRVLELKGETVEGSCPLFEVGGSFGQKFAMGEAHVFMCKRLANDTIVINRYANPGSPKDHTPPEPAGVEHGGLFTPLPSEFKDGTVTCQFTLSNFTSSILNQPNTLDPLSLSRAYHPLFAVGLLNNDNTPQQHDLLSHEPKLNTVQLNQNTNVLYRISD